MTRHNRDCDSIGGLAYSIDDESEIDAHKLVPKTFTPVAYLKNPKASTTLNGNYYLIPVFWISFAKDGLSIGKNTAMLQGRLPSPLIFTNFQLQAPSGIADAPKVEAANYYVRDRKVYVFANGIETEVHDLKDITGRPVREIHTPGVYFATFMSGDKKITQKVITE